MLTSKLLTATGLAGGIPLFLDYFTDTNGVLLSAHTPDIGSGWALLNDTEIEVQSNRAQGKSIVGVQAIAVAEVGQADVYIECDLTMYNTDPPSLAVRATDHLNYLMIRYVRATGNIEIQRYQNGSVTALKELNVGTLGADGDYYTLRVATIGDTIFAQVGNSIAVATSVFNNTATKHGLRARATTTNRWDNFKIYQYNNQLAAGLFKLTNFSESGLASARESLIAKVWRSEGVLPSAGVDSVESDVADPLTTSASNLLRVDKFTTDIGDATDRINYVWYPDNPNGKLVMYHYGHTSENWNAGGKQIEFINALVESGYTVCGSQMPPGSVSGHNLYPAPTASLNPVKYFVEDVIRCINELEGDFEHIYMAGLSGGSWTTIVCAALETRIEKNVHIDGDFPLFINEGSRDYEQFLPGVYPNFDYTDLYVMASSGNRRQIQLNVVSSGLFDKAAYDTAPYEDAIVARIPGSGSYSLIWDSSTTVHEISVAARATILAFFDVT